MNSSNSYLKEIQGSINEKDVFLNNLFCLLVYKHSWLQIQSYNKVSEELDRIGRLFEWKRNPYEFSPEA